MEELHNLTSIKSDKKLLDKEYNNSLKDEYFNKIVSKLKLDKEYLEKYTSLLEESSLEFRNCSNCKGLALCQNKIKGFAYLPRVVDGSLVFEYKPCRFKKNEIKKEKRLKNVKNFNTPDFYKEASISKIYKTDKNRFKTITWLLDFLDNYKEGDKGLYLHGNFGCGKTYLIAATFNELSNNGYKTSIIFWPEFVRDMFSQEFKESMEYVKNVDLLLIDDLGAENLTAYNRDEILCPILQYRMDNKLTTFITSNLNIKELNNHLATSKNGVEEIKAGRIISRIEQLTEDMEMISKNLRK